MNELDYDTYKIKLKPQYNNFDWINNHFNQDFTKIINAYSSIAPPEDSTYNNFFLPKTWVVGEKDQFEQKAQLLDGIFNGIVVVSMCLCFFSLSSSMSANIFD